MHGERKRRNSSSACRSSIPCSSTTSPTSRKRTTTADCSTCPSERADLDGAETHFVAVVLQQDAPFLLIAESRRRPELARGEARAEFVIAALECEHAYAVQPVLDHAILAHRDARVLPHAGLRPHADIRTQFVPRVQIVERGQRAVVVPPLLRVRMFLVVEDLVLESERCATRLVVRLRN